MCCAVWLPPRCCSNLSQAAAAGQVFLYLVVTDRRTVLVLDDRVVFSFITLNLKSEEYPELL